jgi:hypothetical protein
MRKRRHSISDDELSDGEEDIPGKVLLNPTSTIFTPSPDSMESLRKNTLHKRIRSTTNNFRISNYSPEEQIKWKQLQLQVLLGMFYFNPDRALLAAEYTSKVCRDLYKIMFRRERSKITEIEIRGVPYPTRLMLTGVVE